MKIRQFTFRFRPRDSGPYAVTMVDAGAHRIEVTESPTGRSVQVHVDGRKVWPV